MSVLTELREMDWAQYATQASLRGDVIAGLTGVAIVLSPVVAFASTAGLLPEYALYTAMVSPILASVCPKAWPRLLPMRAFWTI